MSGDDLLAEAEALGITEAEIEALSGANLTALMETRRREVSKLTAGDTSLIVPEKPPAGFDWSPANPSAADRLIRAVIASDGNFDAGRATCGCPEDVALAIRADDRYASRYKQIAHDDIYLAEMPKALRLAMQEGGAYALKVGHDIAPKVTQDEADAELARALKVGKDAKLRAIDDLITRLWKAREMLTGGNTPSPEKIAAIVKQVTERAA